MDQEQKPPSFLDDPDLDAQLAALDRGLRRLVTQTSDAKPADAPASPPAVRAPFPTADASPAVPPQSIFPESAFVRTPPASPVARASAAHTSSATPTGSPAAPGFERPRPLLELFPPSVVDGQAATWQGPAAGHVPPPQVGHHRPPGKFEARAAAAAPLTYESFYGLAEKPFTLAADPKFIYHTASHDNAMRVLVDAIGRREAVMVLTGEHGTGKTTLCRSLVEQRRRTTTCFISEPPASFEDLLKVALVDFGVIARDEATRGRIAVTTRQELTTAIGDFSASLAPTQGSALILIDDAQHVPPDVLEPLSALAEATDRGLQVLLVGTPALSRRLAHRDLQTLHRLVTVRPQLVPLSADETAGYVAHRLAVAGIAPRVEFETNALAALHEVTAGVPRVINLVGDRVLTLGFAASSTVIDEGLVLSAAADLDLVPLEPDLPGTLSRMLIVLVVFGSLLAGAAAAAWVLHADLARLVARWQS